MLELFKFKKIKLTVIKKNLPAKVLHKLTRMSVHQILILIVDFRIDSQKCGKKAEQSKKQLYRRHFRGIYISVNSPTYIPTEMPKK